MTRPTLGQMRLRAAKCVTDEVRPSTTDSKLRDDYATTIEEVPMLIRSTGLGPAVATLAARNKEGSERIAKALADWLICGCEYSPYRRQQGAPQSSPRELLDEIAAAGAKQYRLAQAEAIEYAAWLKRLSQGLIKGDGERGGDG
jgi:CRISPR type III-B/RAMP module-associated protein Cmr5